MSAEESPHSAPYECLPVSASVEGWLRERRRHVLFAIIAVAVALRVFCFLELANSPFVVMHEWGQTDMNSFHNWARAIAAGDLWSKTVPPPFHSWHRRIAADYAQAFPDRWAELCAGVTSDDPGAAARRLWERWCGDGRTYQGPLYPYFIALIYASLGVNVVWVFLCQMALGVASVVLIHLLARRLFGELAALLAAALALLYGPLLFYEFVLLRDTLIVFAGLLGVLLLDRARDSRAALPWLWPGLALGLSVALKVHFVFMIAAGVALLIARLWRQWGRLGWATAVFVGGVAIGFSPVVVRNLAAGAPPFAIASNGAATFVTSNAEDVRVPYWGRRHVGRILGETDNALLPAVIATLKTHPSPWSYLRLVGSKLAAAWHSFEQYNNVNFYYARLHSPVLRSLPVSFGLIAPLALVGMVLGLWRFRQCASLYCLVLANLVVVVVFYGFARFRLPLVAALLPFAGFTVAQLVSFLLTRRWKAAGALLITCAAASLWPMSPIDPNRSLVRFADADVGYHYYYNPLIDRALRHGDLPGAREILAESLQAQPAAVRALGSLRSARTDDEIKLAALYAAAYERYAGLLQQAGHPADADVQRQRAAELLQAAGTRPQTAGD
jgi:hypothetical protein